MCDYTPNREAAMTVIERDAGGKPTVWCDPCIAPIVTALNAAGLRTDASCRGHGKVPGWIALTSGQALAIFPDLMACQDIAVEPDLADGAAVRVETAAKVEQWFTNICLDDMLRTEYGLRGRCYGEHPIHGCRAAGHPDHNCERDHPTAKEATK